MAAGVYRDKIFKRQEPKHQLNTQAQNIQINFISQARPKEPPVEGAVVRDQGDSPSS